MSLQIFGFQTMENRPPAPDSLEILGSSGFEDLEAEQPDPVDLESDGEARLFGLIGSDASPDVDAMERLDGIDGDGGGGRDVCVSRAHVSVIVKKDTTVETREENDIQIRYTTEGKRRKTTVHRVITTHVSTTTVTETED